MAPGTVIALGTDGIWEAANAEGRPFGRERFREIIRRHANARAEQIISEVFEEVDRFTEGTPPQDDITLVVIKVETGEDIVI
jgi:sigma-B regulation protein RsbU (phosphoserine phosphatase)